MVGGLRRAGRLRRRAPLVRERVRASHGRDAYFFVVSPLASDEFAGTVWLWNLDSRLGGVELSVFLAGPERWGRGLGTDALNAALDFGFGFTDVERIWLATDASNVRAQRAFERRASGGTAGSAATTAAADGSSTRR